MGLDASRSPVRFAVLGGNVTRTQTQKRIKRVTRHNKRVTKQNNRFATLSPAQKRVAIAKDVLQQMQRDAIIPTTGSWLTEDIRIGSAAGRIRNITSQTQLQAVLKAMQECHTCHLGALFVSSVEIANDFKVGDMTYNSFGHTTPGFPISLEGPSLYLQLEKFFERDQLNMMETVFEQNQGATHHEVGAIYGGINSPADRMRLLMENLILNKGRFDPKVLPRKVGKTWTTPGFRKKHAAMITTGSQ